MSIRAKRATGRIRYVSPVFDDDVSTSGYRYECGACVWKSPVMRWILGAERYKRDHKCEGRR